METRIDEVADGIVRLSTYIPDLAGLTFNQFVIRGDEPLLFHTGMAELFPVVSAAVSRVVRLEALRWIAFGHVEADECGGLDRFLAVCPGAQVAHSVVGCAFTLAGCGAVPTPFPSTPLELGGKRVRSIPTPHVPHGWDAHLLYEDTTHTLLCGDLFMHTGDGPAVVANDDMDAVVRAAVDTEISLRHTTSLAALSHVARRLATLEPRTLGLMHGSTFSGDGSRALDALADAYVGRFTDDQALAARSGRLWDALERP